MRTKPAAFRSCEVGVVTLFEDEFVGLIERMHEGTGAELEIRLGDLEFDDVEDLRANKGPFHSKLELQMWEDGGYGHMSVKFHGDGIRLSASRHYETQYLRVKEYLEARRRLTGRLNSTGWFIVGVVMFVAITALAFARQRAPLVTFGALIAVVYIWLVPKPYLQNQIILTKQHEHQTFLQRHSENVWRLIIALAGVVVGWLLNTASKP